MIDKGKEQYYAQPEKYANKEVREMFDESELAATDLDLIVRTGFDGKTDYTGRFKLIDWKSGSSVLKRHQVFTFGEFDRMFRLADLCAILVGLQERYDGFYVVWTPEMSFDTPYVWVNGEQITQAEFRLFLLNRYYVAPYHFEYDWPPYSAK